VYREGVCVGVREVLTRGIYYFLSWRTEEERKSVPRAVSVTARPTGKEISKFYYARWEYLHG
jgi:hypothetical protein